ncbi:translation initiation factor IF-2-like [Phodopus roborovskii]|uniref:translation initiation factor IF-2-like n=1 Tax=Phodopus roborovskii TaxID=109678 RepID=UPI0021E3CBBB|nr:translation initiation factor IF-2-like [Phodopus roborovskii]
MNHYKDVIQMVQCDPRTRAGLSLMCRKVQTSTLETQLLKVKPPVLALLLQTDAFSPQREGKVSIANPPEKQQPNSSTKHPPAPNCYPRMSPSPESTHALETSGGADNVGWLPSSFRLRRQLRKARRGTEEEAVLASLHQATTRVSSALPGLRPAPRVPPGPAALGGAGAGRGRRELPESRRGAEGGGGEPKKPPRGGEGEGRGRRGRRRPGRSPRRRGRFTSGSPPPRPGDGSWAGGPGSYTPRRDATVPGGRTGRRLSWGPGGLGSAPPPLPAPACVAAAGIPSLHLGGSFAPHPGARQKAQPLAGVLSRLSSYQSRPAAAASLPPGRGLRLRLGLRRVQQPLPAGKVRGGSRRRPRLPLARAEAKVSAAASARVPGLSDARSLTRSHALTGGVGSTRSSAPCLPRSVRGSRLTPERGGRRAAPGDDASRLATALLPLPSLSSQQRLPLLAFTPPLQPPRPERLRRVLMTHQGKRKSRSASGWVRLGPRDCCCYRRRRRRHRLYGRVRTGEEGEEPGRA